MHNQLGAGQIQHNCLSGKYSFIQTHTGNYITLPFKPTFKCAAVLTFSNIKLKLRIYYHSDQISVHGNILFYMQINHVHCLLASL